MVLAMLSWMYDWDPVTAEREFHYSLALAPSYDCGHEYYSGYLAWRHRREESLAEITRARELNPSSSLAYAESALYFQLRDYPSLIEASRKGVASDPTEWRSIIFSGWATRRPVGGLRPFRSIRRLSICPVARGSHRCVGIRLCQAGQKIGSRENPF